MRPRHAPLGIIGAVCLAGAALAQSTLPDARAAVFATCAGRFAALSQHYLDTQNADLDETRLMQSQFADLLGATLPDAAALGITPEQALAWEHAGQQDIAELILTIRLGLTMGRAADANDDFMEKLQICAALLLPPPQ